MIEKLLKEAIDNRIIPGAVFLRSVRGEVTGKIVLGNAALRPAMRPMFENTLFDCASLTKPTVTATLVMLFADRGLIDIHSPVREYLPDFSREDISVYHLLTHTAGLPAWIPLYLHVKNKENLIPFLGRVAPESAPGEKIIYSCLGYILLGKILEKISEAGLDILAAREIFGPLQMSRACYNPDEGDWENCAATEDDNFFERRQTGYADHHWRDGTICGEVHDENAHWLGGVSGNAGLFATAADLSAFSAIYTNGSSRFLSDKSRKLLTEAQVSDSEARRSCGFAVLNEGILHHTGFTGTALRIDLRKNETLILLTNAVHCGSYGEVMNPLRTRIFEAANNEF